MMIFKVSNKKIDSSFDKKWNFPVSVKTCIIEPGQDEDKAGSVWRYVPGGVILQFMNNEGGDEN